jgi:Putative MetA-pathway of phenol degradation
MPHLVSSQKLLTILAVATAVLLPTWVHADNSLFSVGLGAEYASGDYGTGIRTDSFSLPFTVAVYPTKRLDFTLQIPFVYQSTSAVVAGEFMGMQSQSMGTTATMMAAGPGMAGSTGPGPRTTASADTLGKSRYGLGDMTLKGGYILYTEENYVPAIRPNFFVKFPTADKNEFLGTGAFDEGFGVELSKWIGKWLTDGEMGYTIQGKSTVLAVKNYLYYAAGVGYQVNERFRPMLIFKGNTAPVEGATAQLEARLRVKYQFTKQTGIDGYLAKGITAASPDYGTGLSVFYDF